MSEKKLLEDLPFLFLRQKNHKKDKSRDEDLESEPYRQIGQLKVELEWLKKVRDILIEKKRALIEKKK